MRKKSSCSVWGVALKHNAWRAAQQDSERDNERQFNFPNFYRKCHSRKLNLKERYVPIYSYISLILQKNYCFMKNLVYLEVPVYMDVEIY